MCGFRNSYLTSSFQRIEGKNLHSLNLRPPKHVPINLAPIKL